MMESGRSGGEKILIMDDDAEIRTYSSRVLGRCGFIVVEATDGDEALATIKEMLRAGDPCAGAIFDLFIPGRRNGAEVILALRLFDPWLPVIASSGYALHPIMVNPHEFGFNDRLIKPYEAGEPIETVQRNVHFAVRSRSPAA
jgi:CheY-like chemotaxis protein